MNPSEKKPVTIAPTLLIAMPQLQDPNFTHTIVLLFEHEDQGALGVVLNRPARAMLGEVLSTQGIEVREPAKDPVHIGGPVGHERGFIVHRNPATPLSKEVGDGVFVSAAREALETCAHSEPANFRLCLGYAGWGGGQLDKEIAEGSWLTAPIKQRLVFDTLPQEMWAAVLRDIGVDPMRVTSGGSTLH